MKHIKVAAAITFDKDDHILICQRHASDHMGLHWEFPGGKIEPEETAAEAVIRECREELNLALKEIRPYAMFSYDYPDRHIDFTFFLCRAGLNLPERRVHDDIRWVKPASLSDFTFCPADEHLIVRLMREYAAE